MLDSRKIGIIGAGHVGSHVAASLLAQGLCDQLVLLDIDRRKAEAQADDLQDTAAFTPRGTRVRAGDYSELSDAGVIAVCAGGLLACEDRLEELSGSLAVMDQIIPGLRDSGFGGILVVVTNPVDLVARYLAWRLDLPWGRVIGSGTTLDTARLTRVLSRRTGVAQRSIRGFVLGEHGESQVVCWSQVAVEGIPLGRLMDTDPAWAGLDLRRVEEETRGAGWGILTGKGSTEFGIGAAMAEIIRAIQGDEGRVLPVSVPVEGDGGVFVSIPCVLGRGGAEKALAPDLAPEEQKKLAASCQRLAEVWNQTVEGK